MILLKAFSASLLIFTSSFLVNAAALPQISLERRQPASNLGKPIGYMKFSNPKVLETYKSSGGYFPENMGDYSPRIYFVPGAKSDRSRECGVYDPNGLINSRNGMRYEATFSSSLEVAESEDGSKPSRTIKIRKAPPIESSKTEFDLSDYEMFIPKALIHQYKPIVKCGELDDPPVVDISTWGIKGLPKTKIPGTSKP